MEEFKVQRSNRISGRAVHGRVGGTVGGGDGVVERRLEAVCHGEELVKLGLHSPCRLLARLAECTAIEQLQEAVASLEQTNTFSIRNWQMPDA